MNALIVIGISILTLIITESVQRSDSKLGDFLDMQFGHSLLFIIVALLLIALRAGIKKLRRSLTETEIPKFRMVPPPPSETQKVLINCRDLYLKKHPISDSIIEYQLLNKAEIVLWRANCTVNKGRINSIWISSGDRENETVLHVDVETPGLNYVVKEGPNAIGYIIAISNGYKFDALDNALKYSVTFETNFTEGLGCVADWLISLETGTGFSSESNFTYISFKDGNEETVGKYYIALNNLDLTPDINSKFDMRIAAAFSVFIDNTLHDLRSDLL